MLLIGMSRVHLFLHCVQLILMAPGVNKVPYSRYVMKSEGFYNVNISYFSLLNAFIFKQDIVQYSFCRVLNIID